MTASKPLSEFLKTYEAIKKKSFEDYIDSSSLETPDDPPMLNAVVQSQANNFEVEWNFVKPETMVTKPKTTIELPKPKTFLYNQTIEKLFAVKHVDPSKLIGIEIEVEGFNLFKTPTKWWGVHKEDSLRPYKGCSPLEYALTEPIEYAQVDAALSYLTGRLLRESTELNLSERTSTHVHLNVQSWTFKQVVTLLCLYLIFEDILVEWCGSHRVGNMFCLRARDAQYFIRQLRNTIMENNYGILKTKHSDNLRYVSCNLAALAKFGSMEWRALRGTADQTIIKAWVDILYALYNNSLLFADPRAVITTFEALGPKAFTQTYLGPDWTDDPRLHDRLWESVRNIRELAYASDWAPDPVSVAKRRSRKKTNG